VFGEHVLDPASTAPPRRIQFHTRCTAALQHRPVRITGQISGRCCIGNRLIKAGLGSEVLEVDSPVRNVRFSSCVGQARPIERHGLPLAPLVSAANTKDGQLLLPLLVAVPAVSGQPGRPRRRLKKVHADKAYDARILRAAVSARGIAVRIARKAVETSKRLGRNRWVVERTMSWLMRYRRLVRRYDRYDRVLRRVRHHRLRPHLLPPTHQADQLRHALRCAARCRERTGLIMTTGP
jgi:transposase